MTLEQRTTAAALSESYLTVVRTCNTVIYNLGKNLWSKYFPEDSGESGKLNLNFDIEPGDSTPRRVLVCLAKQVHNFKCVSKILDRVKEAENFLQELNEDSQPLHDSVNMARLSSICSQLTVLAKCEAAMRKRHSVRHRVLSVGSARVACYALCDIDCPLLGIRLTQLESYNLIDNSNQQAWVIEEVKSGRRQRVPPVFLAVEADTAEVARIRRAWGGLAKVAGGLVASLATELASAARSLRTEGQDAMRAVLPTSDMFKSFLYRVQMLERSLKILVSTEGAAGDSGAAGYKGEFRGLLDTIDILSEKFQRVLAAESGTITDQLTKMQKGLGVLRSFAHAQDVLERVRSGVSGGGGSSQRSFRSGRSHPLTAPQRRTSVFEFEFEFIEDTKKLSTVTTRSLTSSRFTSETVTRQRQEVARKFVIQSVWDGRKQISLQDAVSAGIVDFQRGIYVALLGDRKEMPMEAAMAAGKIRVEMVTEQQVSEDTSSFGIINIEEIRLTEDGTPTGVTSNVSYVVHAVVDVAEQKRVNFQEAAQLGLIDRETGAFMNSATKEVLPITEAISRGFLKAYVADDPNSLDIDISSRPSAQNFSRLKNRWNAVSNLAKNFKGGGGDKKT